MLHFMTGDEFLKLGKRDFENQTVLDEIHNSLQDRQLLLTEREELRTEAHRVMAALRESLKLQCHYAKLLNMHDGGERMTFQTPAQWMDRIDDCRNEVNTVPHEGS